MNLQRSISYVHERGGPIERARLAAILWSSPPAQHVLDELAKRQKPDGGYAYWVPQVSNICDTVFVLNWFDDLSVRAGPVVAAACRFLLASQHKDGGWDEVETVGQFDPPGWMVPGRPETRVWLTAYCAHVLLRFGHAEAPGTYCPTDFLLAHSDEHGRLLGYLRATWIALPVLAFHPGPDSAPFCRAVEVVQDSYRADFTGAYVGWLIRCLHDAGLPAQHPLVARSLDYLELEQRPDGSWSPEEGQSEAHAVDATIAALRALRSYGRI